MRGRRLALAALVGFAVCACGTPSGTADPGSSIPTTLTLDAITPASSVPLAGSLPVDTAQVAPASDTTAPERTESPIVPTPVVLSAQFGSRAYNNLYDVVDWRAEEYSSIDEAAFFASRYEFQFAEGLVLPTHLVGYRNSQATLPSDVNVSDIARAIGIDVPVLRRADIPGDPSFVPPPDFAFWEAFDSSTGEWFTAIRTGVYEEGLPVLFDFQGPTPIVDGQYGLTGDTGQFCELTDEPVPDLSRFECEGDIAFEIDEVTLPTVEHAEAIAAEIVAAADPTAGPLRFDTVVTQDTPWPNVTVDVRPITPMSPLRWRFEFGADGNLQFAQGNVAGLDVVDGYPLIGLDEAIERLEDLDMRWLAPAGIEQQTEPHPPEPASRQVTIVSIEPDLWTGASPEQFVTANYGHSYWIPAYAFVDSEGFRHLVPAVTDEYLLPPE